MAANGAKKVAGIGELLWDLLPDGPRLGGTVSNCAVMLSRLGSHGIILSAVGEDELGKRAREELARTPVDTSLLQTAAGLPTGSVGVTLSGEGKPEYTIHEPVAWDALEWTPEWQGRAAEVDCVLFGTLAQREEKSRETIQKLVAGTRPECVRLFDVNLRAPFYTADLMRSSLEMATVLKLNDEELPLMFDLCGLDAPTITEDDESEARAARLLLETFQLKLVCVTLGSRGSLLVTATEQHRHHGVKIQVVDTVGAGDAFCAGMAHYYLQGAPLAVINEAGNRWGSWVASQAGAMPALDAATLQRITAEIAAAGEASGPAAESLA